MNWTVYRKRREAVSDSGYRITWAEGPRGTWLNAYSPSGASIEAGYSKEAVKAACERHREKLADKRAMYAAHKAEREVLLMRELRWIGRLTYDSIGRMFGLSYRAVWAICNGETWTHLPMPWEHTNGQA